MTQSGSEGVHLPRFRPGELVRVVREVSFDWSDDLCVEVGMTGRVASSYPEPSGEGWEPSVAVDQILEHPDALAGLPIPEDALESLGTIRAMSSEGELGDPEPLDPADHAASFWREIIIKAYTATTDGDVAAALAGRLVVTLRELGIFDRVEVSEIERHWHEPHEYRLWFHLGADAEPAAAFYRVLGLRPGGWTDCDDDGFYAEASWSAEADPDPTPFLSPEVTHLSVALFPQRDPRNRG